MGCALADDFVVLRMGTDPDPIDPIVHLGAKCSIVIADPYRPELADAFEMKRRMAGIRLQQVEVLVCYLADICRERLIQRPESRRSKMLQSSRALPAL